MRRNFLNFVLLSVGAAAPVFAQTAFLPTPLATPLQLPPGNTEVLQIDQDGSYMGDAVRVVDCPNAADEPFGTCGNELFGGVGLWNSHLTGAIQITFQPPVNGVSHFTITHPFNLVGTDTTLAMPQFYTFPATSNVILDTFDNYSSGDLDLTTGLVSNLNYSVIFFNEWYGAFGEVNPHLKPPPFSFPGIYGTALANFSQRSDGKLDFSFYGSTFLPLGSSTSIGGSSTNLDPVRLPIPFGGPLLQLGSIQVPGMSLHPHLRITTIPNTDPPCGSVCYNPTPNSVIRMTTNPRFSVIGDDYTLNIPQLGFVAAGAPKPEGHSDIMGDVQVQFGAQNGNYIPVAFHTDASAGFLAPPPPLPIAGLSLGFFGADTHLKFPLLTYSVVGVVVLDDPFDSPVGEMDVRTGQMVGGLTWRSFWNHTLLAAVLTVNATRGLTPFSFQQRGPGLFQTGPNGEVLFRYSSTSLLPFSPYLWPSPDYTNPGAAFPAGPGSFAQPFVRIQAAYTTDTPTQVFAASQSNATSTYGETFSYSLSVPCNGTTGTPAFTYTNGGQVNSAHKGTFTLTRLSSVSCINSVTSTAAPGNYDSIQFVAYGTWSADSNPHFAQVNVSTNPSAPYVSILIDGSSTSNADIAPLLAPTP
jgi:hypothetical protein